MSLLEETTRGRMSAKQVVDGEIMVTGVMICFEFI